MKRVLVIDDDQSVTAMLEELLGSYGYSVTVALDAIEGEKLAIAEPFDLVLLDLRMPGKNGVEVTRGILSERPECRILIITGHPTDPAAQEALAAGAEELVPKPFEFAKIMDALEKEPDVDR